MKKNKEPLNLLEKIPCVTTKISRVEIQDDNVTLVIENRGIMNKLAQMLFTKPRFSYIHLDENGSFAWQMIDGKTNIIEIGKKVDEHFGEKAHPLYERLSHFFNVLASYGFIELK